MASGSVATPKVLLIAGAAHGGTTITGMLLGQHPQIFLTGKLRNFPHGTLFDGENFCSCGEVASACPFWLEVRDRFRPYEESPEAEKGPHLYRTISQVSGRSFVGDVTHKAHDIERLMGLSGIELRLIHVVRDLEAVVYSRLRKDYKLGRVKAQGWSHLTRAVKVARRWQEQKRLFVRAESRLGERALRIDYEELCLQPQTVLEQTAQLLGLDFGEVIEKLQQGAPLQQPPHMLRGNARLRSQSEIHVRYDTAYRREMPRLDRLVCRAIEGMGKV